MKLAVASLLALLALPAAGLEPYLVKDIDPVPWPDGSRPRFPVKLGGAVLFFADDGLAGRQLWRSDGTAGGTWQVSDAPRGELPSPKPFQVTERLCFFVSDPSFSRLTGLWVSDGTPAGTFRLTAPGVWIISAWPPLWVAAQGVLYFAAYDEEHGVEPWRSDGTPAGTYRIADLRPGPEGSLEERGMAEHRGRIWFGANDGKRGGALWSTDGTEAGTVLAVDPLPDSADGYVPTFVSAVGGRLAFFAQAPDMRRRLWVGDGIPEGTAPVLGRGSPGVLDAVVQGDRLYFIAADRKGQELWVSDGTAGGTRALTAFALHNAFYSYDFLPLPRQPGVRGRFVFFADDGAHGAEPWVTDGTPQGTRLVRDVCPGICSSEPVPGPVFAGRLTFAADGPFGRELWSTDGTRPGTRRLSDACPGSCGSLPAPWDPEELGVVAAGSRVFFVASNPEHSRNLWASDGTRAGDVRISDFAPGVPWSDPWFFGFFGAALDGRLLFNVDDEEHGDELWIADGTPAGTRLLADLNRTDAGGSVPDLLRPLGNQVVFKVQAAGGPELWKSDGTAAGTVRVRAFAEDEPDGATLSAAYAEAGGLLFYRAEGIWRTDGTEAGTFPLARRPTPGCCSSGPSPPEMRAVGSTVFFDRVDEHGDELWASDGTVAGTRLVLDILPGREGSMPRGLTAFQGRLWFAADAPGTPGIGRELWKSDGTAAGTMPVADLLPGGAGSDPRFLTVHAGRLWFFATGAESGRELWSSDGTAAGTRLEVDVTPGAGSSPEPQILVSLGDRLVFSFPDGGLWASDGTGTRKIHDRGLDRANVSTVFRGRLWFVSQQALWTSDGTEAGTAPLLDRDGHTISGPYLFAPLGDRLVLTAQEAFGQVLWESDGTPAGTFRIEPQVGLSFSFELVAAGERVFFQGHDPATGRELWAVRKEVP